MFKLYMCTQTHVVIDTWPVYHSVVSTLKKTLKKYGVCKVKPDPISLEELAHVTMVEPGH